MSFLSSQLQASVDRQPIGEPIPPTRDAPERRMIHGIECAVWMDSAGWWCAVLWGKDNDKRRSGPFTDSTLKTLVNAPVHRSQRPLEMQERRTGD